MTIFLNHCHRIFITIINCNFHSISEVLCPLQSHDTWGKTEFKDIKTTGFRKTWTFNIIYSLFKSLNTAFDSCLFVWKLMTPRLRKKIIVYSTLFLSMWCQLWISAASSYWLLTKIWKKRTLPVAPKASKHSMGLRSPASTASAQNINCLEDNKWPQSVSWDNTFTSFLFISL